MVSEIALKWTKLSKTGTLDVKFMGVDLSTIMFTLEKGQDSFEVRFTYPSTHFCMKLVPSCITGTTEQVLQ